LAFATLPVLLDVCAASCFAGHSSTAPMSECHHTSAPAPSLGHAGHSCHSDHDAIVKDDGRKCPEVRDLGTAVDLGALAPSTPDGTGLANLFCSARLTISSDLPNASSPLFSLLRI
jgi:hypothetical protein